MRRQRAVRLGVPALIVAALAVLALWRTGVPRTEIASRPAATSGREGRSAAEEIVAPIRTVVHTITGNAIGREASIEVEVLEVTSAATFWAGERGTTRVFAVLDPAVERTTRSLQAGTKVSLAGSVEAVPDKSTMRQWRLDAPTMSAVQDAGVYLRVRELRRLR